MEGEESTLERNRSGGNQSPSFEEEPHYRRSFNSQITVEPIILAIFLAAGLAESVTVKFILTRTCEIHFHYNRSVCSKLGNSTGNGSYPAEAVQQYSAVILTGMSFLSQILPALMCLFAGPWSDYNGRKLLLVIPAFGFFLKYTLMFILCFFPNLGPEYVFVAAIPESLSGGVVNLITAGFAYVSDVTHKDNQSFRITVLECVIYLGSIVGVFSTSYVYKAGGPYGFMLVYGISALVVIFATVPTYFFLPESVATVEGGKGLFHVFEVKLLKEMFVACFKKREGCKRTVIFLVILTLTISISCGMGESNVLFLFTNLRFGWDIREFSMWQFTSFTIAFLGLIFGTFVLTKWLKVPDVIIGLISYVMSTAKDFYVAFVPPYAPQMMFFSGLINLFGGLCGAVGRTLLSKSVPKEELGKVFALTGASEAITPLLFAPLYTFLYGITLKTLPSAFFLLSGSLNVLCCIFYIVIYFLLKGSDRVEYERMESEREAEGEEIIDSH